MTDEDALKMIAGMYPQFEKAAINIKKNNNPVRGVPRYDHRHRPDEFWYCMN